ncbi:MAG: ATP-binding protein [Myxococcota bacterium]
MRLEQLETLRRVLSAAEARGLGGLVQAVAALLPSALQAPRAAVLVRHADGSARAAAAFAGADPVEPQGAEAWPGAHVVRRPLTVDGRSDGELSVVHVASGREGGLLAEALADCLALAVEREEALASERRLTALFNSGPVVVFRWRNAEGWPVEDVSANVTKEFGWSTEQLIGRPYAPLIHPDDLERVAAEVAAEVAAGRAYFEQQYRLVDRRGAARRVYDFTHALRDARGEVTHFHGYVFDDSRRFEAERAREELEQRLLQSQKLQAAGTLASGVAHDFNNVLASVLAHIELALRRVDDQRAQDDLSQAMASAQHGRDVVKQMLLFTRSIDAERAPVRLDQVVERALAVARAGFPPSVMLTMDLSPSTPLTLADATQLEQVVLALVTNAVHAMPDGGELSVALEAAPSGPAALADRRCLRLTVRDTGDGMTPDVARRAFEPFFTTRDVGRGAGLGLAMVHGIVTAHDGVITLDSRPGAGTTVTVWLPATGTPPPAPPPQPSAHPHGRGERIAVVDDHVALAKATGRLIQSLGFQAKTFTTGQDLLAAFDEAPRAFDLVLTDQSMPDLTGVELAVALRQRGITVPVLLVTGLVTSVDVSGVEPPVRVLSKPYRSEELVEVLQALLRR